MSARESDAEFVEYWVNARKINCYTSDPQIFYRLLDLAQEALARRDTAPAPQRRDGYRAGLMRAAEIAEGARHPDYSAECEDWIEGTEFVARAIRAEAAAPEPPVVIDGTSSSGGAVPVAWQWFWASRWHTEDTHDEAHRMCPHGGFVRPLYTAPPAPVPAGEVTAHAFELLRHERNVLQKICARRADMLERIGLHADCIKEEVDVLRAALAVCEVRP